MNVIFRDKYVRNAGTKLQKWNFQDMQPEPLPSLKRRKTDLMQSYKIWHKIYDNFKLKYIITQIPNINFIYPSKPILSCLLSEWFARLGVKLGPICGE